jgi:secreted trypsin-like serine protease
MMSANKVIRGRPLWATLVGSLVVAMVVSFLVFAQSGEAAPQAVANEQSPYASVSPKIIGGTEVPNGKYPFMVALLDKGKPGGAFQEQFCTGTLIDKDSVLTAGHCFFHPKTGVFERGMKLEVVVGRMALNQNQGQLRSVPHRFIHPRFKHPKPSTPPTKKNLLHRAYDVAVLKLNRPVTGIKPIKPATAKQNNLENPGQILRAAGWGAVTTFPILTYPLRLREVLVPVVSDSRAKRTYNSLPPSAFVRYFPSLEVAAGKKGKGPCYADSGGPLFDSGSRTQVGITSYTVRECATARYPVVFTEVNNPEIRSFILWAAKR